MYNVFATSYFFNVVVLSLFFLLPINVCVLLLVLFMDVMLISVLFLLFCYYVVIVGPPRKRDGTSQGVNPNK